MISLLHIMRLYKNSLQSYNYKTGNTFTKDDKNINYLYVEPSNELHTGLTKENPTL